jgi:hypothetical protein
MGEFSMKLGGEMLKFIIRLDYENMKVSKSPSWLNGFPSSTPCQSTGPSHTCPLIPEL